MPEQYPFVLANTRIGALLDSISTAARPPKFSQEFLRTLGFTSSADRAFVPLFRSLGLINDSGVPTEAYDRLRDRRVRAQVLADRIRDLYADLFAINTDMHKAPDEELRGAISRVTGKDAATIQRYASTFKALAGHADFSTPSALVASPSGPEEAKPAHDDTLAFEKHRRGRHTSVEPEFHYNIQIHLPATTDVSVYNAIFRALKDNLDI